MYIMTKKWTIPELLQLQREYELLKMTIDEIAVKHGRSVQSIFYRLKSEGFVSNDELDAITILASKFDMKRVLGRGGTKRTKRKTRL